MAKSSTKPHFSKKEAISYGFKLAKENLFFFIILFVIVMLVSGVMAVLRIVTLHLVVASLVLGFMQLVVNLIIGIGIINICLKFLDNRKPKYKDLFYYKPIVNYVLASIVEGFIVFVGFLLLIIPGIFFALRLQYTCYLIIDKNFGLIEAIKTSWKITRGNAWNLFFFGILLGLINILGALCLLIGLFVTVPLSMLATTFVYRKLLNASK